MFLYITSKCSKELSEFPYEYVFGCILSQKCNLFYNSLLGSQCADVKEWAVFMSNVNLDCKNSVPDMQGCRSYCKGFDACEGFHFYARGKKCCAKTDIGDGERGWDSSYHSGLRDCAGIILTVYYYQ